MLGWVCDVDSGGSPGMCWVGPVMLIVGARQACVGLGAVPACYFTSHLCVPVGALLFSQGSAEVPCGFPRCTNG